MDPSPGRFMSIAVSAGNSSYVHWSRKIIVYYQDPHCFNIKHQLALVSRLFAKAGKISPMRLPFVHAEMNLSRKFANNQLGIPENPPIIAIQRQLLFLYPTHFRSMLDKADRIMLPV